MRVCLTACVYLVTCERNGECMFNGVCVYRVTCERNGECLFNGVCVPCYM